jgi:hypothetical protein
VSTTFDDKTALGSSIDQTNTWVCALGYECKYKGITKAGDFQKRFRQIELAAAVTILKYFVEN